MKTILRYSKIALLLGGLFLSSCEGDFDEINTNPNALTEGSSEALFSQALWNFAFNDFDVWYGGRSSMVAAQQWCQRNYTSEDRYAFRSNVNDGIFRNNYIWLNNLQRIIELNKDDKTKAMQAALYGDNRMQIACCELVKVWVFQLLTDTYGDVPYTQALSLMKYPQPKYDSQKSIYDDLIKVVGAQASVLEALIDEGISGYANGDLFYKGDLNKWYKFANSLQLRLALRAAGNTVRSTGNLDPAYLQIAKNAIGRGVFTSNMDNAQVLFSSVGVPNEAPMYNGFYTGRRNDFTMAAGLVKLVKGLSDANYGFVNPFEGFLDPRWKIFRGPYYASIPPLDSKDRVGMPYGMPDAKTQGFRTNLLSYSFAIPAAQAAKVIRQDFPSTFLDYPTVCFMISEVNNWDAAYFEKGILASVQQWGADTTGMANAYLKPIMAKFTAASAAMKKEMVFTQKYIHLYMQAYEAWAEYRRTGYPRSLVKPGQTTAVISGSPVIFNPISGNESGSDVIARFKYPTSEFTLNADNVAAAIAAQGGENSHAVRMWWAGGGKQ